MQNPYQSPTSESPTPPATIDRPDYGVLAGWYFRFLAAVSVVTFLYGFFIRGVFVPDWTPVLTLWTGHLLMRRSATARSWVIAICSMFAIITILMMLVVIFVGTENILLSYGSLEIQSLSTDFAIGLLGVMLLLLFAIPVFLLANRKATRQFAANTRGDDALSEKP